MISKNIKSRFPVFQKKPELVFFDTAASALKVDSMIGAINNCYSYEYANIHITTPHADAGPILRLGYS